MFVICSIINLIWEVFSEYLMCETLSSDIDHPFVVTLEMNLTTWVPVGRETCLIAQYFFCDVTSIVKPERYTRSQGQFLQRNCSDSVADFLSN